MFQYFNTFILYPLYNNNGITKYFKVMRLLIPYIYLNMLAKGLSLVWVALAVPVGGLGLFMFGAFAR